MKIQAYKEVLEARRTEAIGKDSLRDIAAVEKEIEAFNRELEKQEQEQEGKYDKYKEDLERQLKETENLTKKIEIAAKLKDL